MVKSLRRVILDVNNLKREVIKKLKMYDPILVYKANGNGWSAVQFAYFKEDKENDRFEIHVFDGDYNPTSMEISLASPTTKYSIDSVMVLNEIYLCGFREANADANEVIEKKEEA